MLEVFSDQLDCVLAWTGIENAAGNEPDSMWLSERNEDDARRSSQFRYCAEPRLSEGAPASIRAGRRKRIFISAGEWFDFQQLVERWRQERGSSSSTTWMISQPSYQRIIGLGEKAIPLLLGELQRRPDHWFAALRAVSGVDPVPPELRGNIRQMAGVWIRWGAENGYVELKNGHQ